MFHNKESLNRGSLIVLQWDNAQARVDIHTCPFGKSKCLGVYANEIPGGKILPGKINFGKILSEISGQYFYQGFKTRDRIFPAIFKKIPISSSDRLNI